MSYDIPFKLRVLNGLTDCLREIMPVNGYKNDLYDLDLGDGGTPIRRVVRGVAWFGENDPLPMISILEGVEPGIEVSEPPANTPVSEYDWPLLIQGWIEDDKVNPTDPAYVLLADVRQRLAIEARRKLTTDTTESDIFGLKTAGASDNTIERLTFGPGVVRPADELSNKAWFWLSVTIRVVDKAALPYA